MDRIQPGHLGEGGRGISDGATGLQLFWVFSSATLKAPGIYFMESLKV